MKKLILGIAAALMVAAALPARSQTIDRPRHGYTDTQVIEIDKAELSPGKTRLILDVYSMRRPFAFSDNVALESGGRLYPAAGIEEITVAGDKKPEEVEPRKFVLTFPAMPDAAVPVTLEGGYSGGTFRICGIDLTGTAGPYTPQLPADAFTDRWDSAAQLPDPRFEIAETSVNIHITGMDESADVAAPLIGTSDPFTGEGGQIDPQTVAPGEYRFRFERYASGCISLAYNGAVIPVVIHPGESIDVWIDLTAMNLRKSKYRSDPDMLWCYFTGELSDVNNAAAHHPLALDPYANQFPRVAFHLDRNGMSVEDYLKAMMQKIEDETAAINAEPGVSGQVKEARIIDKKVKCLRAIKEMQIMLSAYRRSDDTTLDGNAHLLWLIKDAALDDPKLIYGSDFAHSVPVIAETAGRAGVTGQLSDTDRGWMHDWQIYPILRKAETRETVTPQEEAVMAAASPYYRELYDHLKSKTEREYNAALQSGRFEICPTPQYGDVGELLQNIVDSYPGQVVFVDFWATWCGPCLNGMRTIRPFKPEMKEHGVVSVYITTESSPKTKWTLSLPDIGGQHYYLTQEEWRTMLDKYGFTGIPTYMIFDKQGRKAFQSTGFPGVEKLRSEFEKVW